MTEQQHEEKRYDPNDTTLKFVTRQDDISMYLLFIKIFIFVFILRRQRETENKCALSQ